MHFTCREGHEGRVFLKVAIMVQKVLRVKGRGGCPLLFLFQHRVQQGDNDSVLNGNSRLYEGDHTFSIFTLIKMIDTETKRTLGIV